MPVTFNHSMLAARITHESARSWPTSSASARADDVGAVHVIEFDGGVTIQFAEPPVDEIQMQHYAFLVDDERFDEILGAGAGAGDPRTRPTRNCNGRRRSTRTMVGGASTSSTPQGHGIEVLTRPYGDG